VYTHNYSLGCIHARTVTSMGENGIDLERDGKSC